MREAEQNITGQIKYCIVWICNFYNSDDISKLSYSSFLLEKPSCSLYLLTLSEFVLYLKNNFLELSIETFGSSLQLTEMMDNRAGDLSGGQKRKLCIVLSLLGDPPFVIMDEPTAGVDVQSRQTIWKTIGALKDVTKIITSHNL
jgi:ABC-type multidrug transport system ATPase subunit